MQNNALADTLEIIQREEGGTSRPAVEQKYSWVDKKSGDLEWTQPDFGSLVVQGRNCIIGGSHEQPRLSIWTELSYRGKPDKMAFVFDVNPNPGVRVLHIASGQMKDVTETGAPSLAIDVDWHGNIPFTRKKHKDNIDLVFLNDKEGTFIQQEVSLTSRGPQLWLAVQWLYAGQVVRTTAASAARLGLRTRPSGHLKSLVVPIISENAYPGSDYFASFPGSGQVVQYALDRGAFVPLSKCVVAKWEPKWVPVPAAAKQNGYMSGVVNWFCFAFGGGSITLEDGSSCFVHFSVIQDENGKNLLESRRFPMLEPQTPVAVKFAGEDRRVAVVRVLEQS